MDGIGIDILKNERIKKRLTESFINHVLTEGEREIYNQKKGKKQLHFICGRYAVKEAIIKSLSDYENPHMLEIEVLNNDCGKPYVNYKEYKMFVSISHEEDYTIAIAYLKK